MSLFGASSAMPNNLVAYLSHIPPGTNLHEVYANVSDLLMHSTIETPLIVALQYRNTHSCILTHAHAHSYSLMLIHPY